MIIAEIGINHDGSFEKAVDMIVAAKQAGCECVKFQCHIPEAEMLKTDIIPSNANETLWDMMTRCAFTVQEEILLKEFTERLGMIYLSTPFSREAVDRLDAMGVTMFKVGSGECNNYPLLKHIASKGKPVILSTGMQNSDSIKKAVDILGNNLKAIMYCVSKYPTPYENIDPTTISKLLLQYGWKYDIGFSDHSLGIYSSLVAIYKGATIIEKHFTLDRNWPGPDNKISILPHELKMLIEGEKAIRSMGKSVPDESDVKEFAFHSVVSIKDIQRGSMLTRDNCWVKRPGGGIPASEYENLLGKRVLKDIKKDTQINHKDLVWKH